MRTVCVVALCTAISGCAMSELTVPMTGKLSNGRDVAGSATARVDGNSTFAVALAGGVTCSGNYDSTKVALNFTVPLLCADGRRGAAVIERRSGGLSGTAVVTLDEGTTGTFVFGNLKYEQAFNEMGGPVLTDLHEVDSHEPDWVRTP